MPFSIHYHHQKINHDPQGKTHRVAPSDHTARLNLDYSIKKQTKTNTNKAKQNRTKHGGLVVPIYIYRYNITCKWWESRNSCAHTESHFMIMISGHKHGFAFLILQSSWGGCVWVGWRCESMFLQAVDDV